MRIQVETCNRADDGIPSILIVQFARIDPIPAGFIAAITLQIEDVLIGGNAEIVVLEWSNHRWKAGTRNAESVEIAVLKIGIALGSKPRKQHSRAVPGGSAFGFLDSSIGYPDTEICLQRFFNRVSQS